MSWTTIVCIMKTGNTRIRVAKKILPPFKGEHSERVWTLQKNIPKYLGTLWEQHVNNTMPITSYYRHVLHWHLLCSIYLPLNHHVVFHGHLWILYSKIWFIAKMNYNNLKNQIFFPKVPMLFTIWEFVK